MAKGSRKGGGAKTTAARPSSTVAKPKGLKPQSARKLQTGLYLSKARQVNAKLAGRADGASVNIPMSGRRGRALDAEISRNVRQQQSDARARSKAIGRQIKVETTRAKKLRAVHVPAIAKAKGLSKAKVESALKAQRPSVQIKALKNWVRDNRSTAAKSGRRR